MWARGDSASFMFNKQPTMHRKLSRAAALVASLGVWLAGG